jgi:ribose-phosphate pyrophosphokinase
MKQSISAVLFSFFIATNFASSAMCESALRACARNSFSDNAMVFSGNATKDLAQKIADYLQVELGQAIVSKFNDGEIQIQVKETVRGKHIFIVQSTCPTATQSVNDTLMELFLLVRTMKRASAASITVVIPYYGYARQDRKAMARVPISAADVAMMLEEAGVDRVLTIDLHCGQIQGFFRNAPVDNLYSSPIFIDYFVSKGLDNVVVVSPDAGGVERANKFMQQLRKAGVPAEIALISKRRASAGVIESMDLIGNVVNEYGEGANAIIVDDMCDTGGTLVKAAQLLKDSGAKRVYAIMPHGIFSGNALDKIGNSVIYEMVTADTIPLRGQAPANLTCLSVSALLGDAILRIYHGDSVSALFE